MIFCLLAVGIFAQNKQNIEFLSFNYSVIAIYKNAIYIYIYIWNV